MVVFVKNVLISVCCITLVGCATPRPYTIGQWRDAQDRTYNKITKAKFERAVEAVFEASRPGRYQARPDRNGVRFSRSWNHYFVLTTANGSEEWSIYENVVGDGVEVEVNFSGLAGGFLSPTVQIQVPKPEFYDLLWDRVDYVLGLRDYWVTCDEYEKKIGYSSGDVFYGFCGFGADENIPDKVN